MSEMKNLLEYVYYSEKNYPDDNYLTQPMGGGEDNIKTWTWKEAADEARRMASYLKSLNLPEKSNIALCSKNCAYWMLADLAIWMAGHVSVPLFPNFTPENIKYTIEHSDSKVLFVGKLDPVWEEMKKSVPDGVKKIAFPLAPPNDYEKWDEIIKRCEPLKNPAERQPEELATIIYTSGSTGRPKGVMHSFGAMLTSAKGISDFVKAEKKDRALSYLPLAHALERAALESVSIYVGSRVFFADTLDTFLTDLKRAQPTCFVSVPRLWLKFQSGVFQKMPEEKLKRLFKIPVLNRIIKKKILTGLGLSSVRIAASGSAPIPEEVLNWYRNLGLELLEGYAMTENFTYSHFSRSGRVRVGYVGHPLNGVQHRISDTGEIEVKSPCNMMGYYKMPVETKEMFTEDGYIKTGDMGEIDEDGRLKITGRAKECFKTSKGEYVAPAPIENNISNHTLIETSIVSGSGYPSPYVLVTLSDIGKQRLKEGKKVEIEQELVKLLKNTNADLPSYEKLAFMAIIKDEWLPENGFLTPTLKVKRSAIEKEYKGFVNGWFEQGKPVVWQS